MTSDTGRGGGRYVLMSGAEGDYNAEVRAPIEWRVRGAPMTLSPMTSVSS